MAVLELENAKKYQQLVGLHPPRKIHNQKSHRETCAVIERLMRIASPSKEQLEYLELLSTLVALYEEESQPTPHLSHQALLAHLIEAREATQSAVAREAGVSATTISDVLAGRRLLSLENIRRLSTYFNVDVRLFLMVG